MVSSRRNDHLSMALSKTIKFNILYPTSACIEYCFAILNGEIDN